MSFEQAFLRLLLVCSTLVASSGIALADPPDVVDTADEEDTAEDTAVEPWAVGVTDAQKREALKLFEAGNQFFSRSQYSQALVEYRNAIGAWDHPAIRFNMAVCLINLDEALEAHEHLNKGLAYEGAAISADLYKQGQTYMKLLKGRLSWLTISVKETGAKVSLDGRELFVSPGKSTQLLLPGKHQIVAAKEGMLTETENVALESGATSTVDIKLRPLSDGVVLRRRWSTWKPWAVAGSGVGVAVVGGLLYLLADSDFKTFDARVGEQCPTGCPLSELPNDVTSIEDRAELENIASTSLLITGGVLTLTSGVLFYLNRERPVRLEQRPHESGASALRVAPVVGRDHLGISTAIRF